MHSALLEVMAERQVSLGGKACALPRLFSPRASIRCPRPKPEQCQT